ncbi:MAG: hypothetical protein V2J19_04315 [Wenzhouxiangella sp.]|jgi:hypothetical protein|nr:hypothetical protein [Wenzhouxiangella sp.]
MDADLMIRTALFLSVLLAPGVGPAATFCVGTPAELAAALQAAGSNGQNDQIRLKTGSYVPPDESGFSLLIDEANTTEISGGWIDLVADCQLQGSDPRVTSIEGNDSKRLFRLFLATGNTNGNNINFGNLSFRNGSGAVGSGISPIHLAIPSNNNIRVLFDRVFFWSNSGDYAGAVAAIGLKRLAIRNSVFMFNEVRETQGTVAVRLSNDSHRFFFINNTMINNFHSGTQATRCSGVQLSTPSAGTSREALIVNSIFWSNSDYDICVPAAVETHLLHNNYQQLFGEPLAASGNLSGNPMLAPQLNDFTPQPTSPMVNAGLQEPSTFISDPPTPIEHGWSHGDFDFENHAHPRVIGGRVDIGAVEASYIDRLFCDGFHLEEACPE